MLDHLHLGDEVGDLDQFVLGVSAGDDDVDMLRLLVAEERHDLLDGQIRRLEKDFVQKGGIRERMTRARLDDRDGKK